MVERVIAQAIASGAVPPEVTADYLMETRDRPAITALIVLTVLTAIVVGTRCVSRLFILKAFGVDDSLAFFSLVCSRFAFTLGRNANDVIASPHRLCCLVYHSHSDGVRKAYRIYTICPEPVTDKHDRDVGLHCPPNLHHRSILLSDFRSCVLSAAMQTAFQADIRYLRRSCVPDCGVSPSNVPYHLSLFSSDESVAIRVATKCAGVRLPDVGNSICDQFRIVTCMRLCTIHYPHIHHTLLERVETEKGSIVTRVVARHTVSCCLAGYSIPEKKGIFADIIL